LPVTTEPKRNRLTLDVPAHHLHSRFIRSRLDLQSILQGLVDRTSIRDLDQALALFVGQIPIEREAARDAVDPAASFFAAQAIVQVHPIVAKPHLDVFELQLDSSHVLRTSYAAITVNRNETPTALDFRLLSAQILVSAKSRISMR
jgi:hypothetical protein